MLRAGYRGSCARAVSTPRYNIELVFEEIVANIVSDGAADGREVDSIPIAMGRENTLQ